MKKWNCLVVDDEPIARDIVSGYIKQFTELQIVATCANAVNAKALLAQEQIDILFLDINMPVLDGVSFLKTLEIRPQVIFTTAYKEYAIDAFDLAVCDYLLKPFSFERFSFAVEKAIKQLKTVDTQDHFFLRADGRMQKIVFSDLLYAEANGNYVKIVTAEKMILSVMTFASLEKLLPLSIFLKTHRSFIVNKFKINNMKATELYVDKFKIPIGANYKNSVLKATQAFNT